MYGGSRISCFPVILLFCWKENIVCYVTTNED
ncbi:hypothetical protein GLYMA_12G001350v4 [Glycine max]|nr:hypothetical protein GYH30_032248 [Glycine max]KRH23746.2 hypothetical protein GLYMA_12G001350v4 [Glycine max]